MSILRDDARPRLLTTESSQVLLLLLIPLRFGVRGPSLSVAISRVSFPGMRKGGDIVWRWRTGKSHKIPKPNTSLLCCAAIGRFSYSPLSKSFCLAIFSSPDGRSSSCAPPAPPLLPRGAYRSVRTGRPDEQGRSSTKLKAFTIPRPSVIAMSIPSHPVYPPILIL